MPTVQVSSIQPYPIAGVGTEYNGFTVQNSGTTRLYFGHDPSVSPNNFGNFVDPGGSITWPADSPCYCIAGDVGGQINYSPLVANLSGSASGTVSISGAVDVSGSTIGGTVGVSSVGGVVAGAAQAAPVLIATASPIFSTAAQALTTMWSIGNIGLANRLDVSAYNSILIAITQGYSSSIPLAVANYFTIDIYNVDAQILSTVFAPVHAEWLLDTQMAQMIQVPVTAAAAYIVVQLAKAATSTPGELQISLYGSSVHVDTPRYVSSSPLLVGGCANSGYYGRSVGAAGTFVDFISSKNGPAQVNIFGGGSVANTEPFACKGGATQGLAALYTTTTPVVNGASQSMLFPMLPILMQTALTSGTCISTVVQT